MDNPVDNSIGKPPVFVLIHYETSGNSGPSAPECLTGFFYVPVDNLAVKHKPTNGLKRTLSGPSDRLRP